MLQKGELAEHYKTSFFMVHNYHYNFSDLDQMIPYERDIFQSMLLDWLEAERERTTAGHQG